MAIQVEVIVGSETYSLNDSAKFVVQDEDGFGLPPSNLIIDEAPLQHGTLVRDFRLRPRMIFLGVWLKADTEADHYDRREEMIAALKLSATANRLRYTFSDGSQKQIDFFYSRGLSFSTRSRAMYKQKSAIALYCPDPLWYDPNGYSIAFSQVGGTDSMVVPNAVPHTVGGSLALQEVRQISYAGTWRSFPHIIRISGPIANPIITNVTLSKKLDFTGTTIASNDYYEIDLRFGYKTVKNKAGTNKIADLTNDSDLADWHIGADPEVPGGDNSIRATGSGAGESTKVEISYNEMFLGI